MKHVMLVFGTRPEAIKLAPVYWALQADPRFSVTTCSTGQHRQMLDQFTQIFNMTIDHDLNVMSEGQDLFDVTSLALLGLRSVLAKSRVDLVVVQGDTTTSFSGALAGFYSKIKVAHIEAGLRTYTLDAPWPEEANRQLISRICDFHFAPTQRCRDSLISEGVAPDKISVTGNTVIDTLHYMAAKIEESPNAWDQHYGSAAAAIASDRPLILVTGHRRENFGSGFESICNAIVEIATRYPQWEIVYPVHLNPNVRGPVERILTGMANVHLISPLDYPPFVNLMGRAKVILTDSGGIQEEAPSLGKPVLVMRDTTERPEAVEAGTVRLVGTDQMVIVGELERLMLDQAYYDEMAWKHNPYGDGRAAGRIVEFLATAN